MREAVNQLWPEIQWIEDSKLREQVAQTWTKALERSPLKPDDLNYIPFTQRLCSMKVMGQCGTSKVNGM